MAELDHVLQSYADKYDWVKARANQRFNVDRREWTNNTNLGLSEGDVLLVPRNGRGMQFYLNNGFFEVLDKEPEVPGEQSTDSHKCGDCGRTFSSERGLAQHQRQKHEEDKNEGEEE